MKNKEFKIRKILPDDILDLHHIYLNTWLATYPNKEFKITKTDIKYKFSQKLDPKKIIERKEALANINNNQSMLVLEYKGKLVALCNSLRDKKHNTLQAIYVLPEYQGLGFGRALWTEAQKVFDIKKDIIVHVASYNKNAIAFYERLGFKNTEKIIFDEKYKMRNGAIIPELEMIIKAK